MLEGDGHSERPEPRGRRSPGHLSRHQQPARVSLLERIAQGDQAAFAEFYGLTSRRVFGMARRVLVDTELSEDTTQEVFLQVWQNAPSSTPRPAARSLGS